MRKIMIAYFLLNCFYIDAQKIEDSSAKINKEHMKSLFNGKNLDGWYTFLRTKGKGNDPEKVFNIENGLLHISGKEFGYIATKKVYKNFHLVAEFKWGKKKYPPRDADTTRRDNGICYYFPVNKKDFVWPKSIECQIQEGDVGDIWLIDSTTIFVNGIRSKLTRSTELKKVQMQKCLQANGIE